MYIYNAVYPKETNCLKQTFLYLFTLLLKVLRTILKWRNLLISRPKLCNGSYIFLKLCSRIGPTELTLALKTDPGPWLVHPTWRRSSSVIFWMLRNSGRIMAMPYVSGLFCLNVSVFSCLEWQGYVARLSKDAFDVEWELKENGKWYEEIAASKDSVFLTHGNGTDCRATSDGSMVRFKPSDTIYSDRNLVLSNIYIYIYICPSLFHEIKKCLCEATKMCIPSYNYRVVSGMDS